MANVSFWGVRGSTPCPCEANARYGGNTACVTITADGMDPIVLDIGTGLRLYGESLAAEAPFRGLALVSHLHWDHIQGLPFFGPIHHPETSMEVWGRSDIGDLRATFEMFMRPPFFPIRPDQLFADITFRHIEPGLTERWGPAVIKVEDVPHTGDTNGYRIEVDGVVIAYVTDHQQPVEGDEIQDSVLELCEGADLVIHDAQYEPHEFAQKTHWGHCTPAYAVRVAAMAGAKRLALFHHDPSHGDETLDRMLAEAQVLAAGTSLVEVVAAAEGLTMALTGARSTSPA